jgi:hypothetical protein
MSPKTGISNGGIGQCFLKFTTSPELRSGSVDKNGQVEIRIKRPKSALKTGFKAIIGVVRLKILNEVDGILV